MFKSESALSRRQFLEFLGHMSLTTAASVAVPSVLSSCAHRPTRTTESSIPWEKIFIRPSSEDQVILAQGLQQKILLKWQDPIAKGGVQFGTNNDFCAFVPKDVMAPTDGVLMVNHEFVHPLMVSGFNEALNKSKTQEQVDIEQKSVGVSLLRFHKVDDEWKVDFHSPLNRRITAQTAIPFVSKHPIEGAMTAKGTLANCAGGVTPWGTFLTCEENYDQFYGEWDYSPKPGTKARRKRPKRTFVSKDLSWSLHDDRPPTHYGWVVEINPWTGAAKKHSALGRFCHEGATCVRTKSGLTTVYMGDDKASEYLYKFISAKPDSLEEGTLYVAQMKTGRWLPLQMDSHPEFTERFLNQTDLLMRVREAAKILGATPLARPEDVEINPANGDVIVALTNNSGEADYHGSFLKIVEDQADPGALTFKFSTWISGGPQSGISCPDNLAFDKSGNLWCTNDISDEKMNQGIYSPFKNNGLYYIPMKGPRAGIVFQVASAPRDAEFTGPMFTPDGETLLLSVQHPGEQTKDLANPTSSWPDGKGKLPKSALLAITGDTLKRLVNFRG